MVGQVSKRRKRESEDRSVLGVTRKVREQECGRARERVRESERARAWEWERENERERGRARARVLGDDDYTPAAGSADILESVLRMDVESTASFLAERVRMILAGADDCQCGAGGSSKCRREVNGSGRRQPKVAREFGLRERKHALLGIACACDDRYPYIFLSVQVTAAVEWGMAGVSAACRILDYH